MATPAFLVEFLGLPRDNLSDTCQPMTNPVLREMLVTEDWFEVSVAQNLVVDTLVYDLVYAQFDQYLADNGAQDVAMLTEFMQLWYKDTTRWVDAVMKTTVAESEENKALLAQWIEKWRGKAAEALAPLASAMLNDDALAQSLAELDKRVAKAGIK